MLNHYKSLIYKKLQGGVKTPDLVLCLLIHCFPFCFTNYSAALCRGDSLREWRFSHLFYCGGLWRYGYATCSCRRSSLLQPPSIPAGNLILKCEAFNEVNS